MSKRVKIRKVAVEVPDSREQAVEVVRQITGLKTLERSVKAEMDAEVTRIKGQYEASLARIASEIGPLVQGMEAWAEAHRAEFGSRRSMDMLHGVIGWRVTPPAVEPIKGFTWKAVLERLLGLGRTDLVRVKQEVDKPAVLAASKADEDVRPLYMQVVQRDEFFVEPELTESETREVAP